MNEPRGTALSRLGLIKSRSRHGHVDGHAPDATLAELAELEAEFKRIGLRHARQAVVAFRAELTEDRRSEDRRVAQG
ncbi:hypothetical protein HRW18_38425 [Streptomyces lunaelactis]|nr:hypothetical protein [Streptomyces lunaelactis]